MHWNKLPLDMVENIWSNIAQIRAALDELMKQVKGIIYFASAINGINNVHTDGRRKISPGVYFWVVSQEPLNHGQLRAHMTSNSVGADIKINLQPFQSSEKDLCGSLFTGVKDNMGGCVRALVERYQSLRGDLTTEPIVKFYATSEGPRDMLSSVISELHTARFYSQLHYYDV